MILYNPFFVYSVFQIFFFRFKSSGVRLKFWAFDSVSLSLCGLRIKSSLVWFLNLFGLQSVSESFVGSANLFVSLAVIFYTLILMLTHLLLYPWTVYILHLGFCFLFHSSSYCWFNPQDQVDVDLGLEMGKEWKFEKRIYIYIMTSIIFWCVTVLLWWYLLPLNCIVQTVLNLVRASASWLRLQIVPAKEKRNDSFSRVHETNWKKKELWELVWG